MIRTMKERRRKGLFGRSLEWLSFGVVVALPVLYFAWPWLPFAAWLERITVRNPIVLEEAADSRGTTTVYRCVNEGELVLSDEPCGNVVETLALPPRNVNVIPADKVPASRPPTAASSAPCRSIDAELAEIAAQLRAGYAMQRGERLKARRAALLEHGRSIGCL